MEVLELIKLINKDVNYIQVVGIVVLKWSVIEVICKLVKYDKYVR